jgi:hypothetical protein
MDRKQIEPATGNSVLSPRRLVVLDGVSNMRNGRVGGTDSSRRERPSDARGNGMERTTKRGWEQERHEELEKKLKLDKSVRLATAHFGSVLRTSSSQACFLSSRKERVNLVRCGSWLNSTTIYYIKF